MQSMSMTNGRDEGKEHPHISDAKEIEGCFNRFIGGIKHIIGKLTFCVSHTNKHTLLNYKSKSFKVVLQY